MHKKSGKLQSLVSHQVSGMERKMDDFPTAKYVYNM